MPRVLKIVLFFGTFSWDETAKCGTGSQTARAVGSGSTVVEAIMGSAQAGTLTIDRGWAFDDRPFSAEFAKEGTIEALHGTVEVSVEHTPAP